MSRLIEIPGLYALDPVWRAGGGSNPMWRAGRGQAWAPGTQSWLREVGAVLAPQDPILVRMWQDRVVSGHQDPYPVCRG